MCPANPAGRDEIFRIGESRVDLREVSPGTALRGGRTMRVLRSDWPVGTLTMLSKSLDVNSNVFSIARRLPNFGVGLMNRNPAWREPVDATDRDVSDIRSVGGSYWSCGTLAESRNAR